MVGGFAAVGEKNNGLEPSNTVSRVAPSGRKVSRVAVSLQSGRKCAV